MSYSLIPCWSQASFQAQVVVDLAGPAAFCVVWVVPYRIKVTSLRRAVDHLWCGSRLEWVQESPRVRDRFEFVFQTNEAIAQRARGFKYGRTRFDPLKLQALSDLLVEGTRQARSVQHRVYMSLGSRAFR